MLEFCIDQNGLILLEGSVFMAKQEKRPGESIESVLRKFKKKVKIEGTLQDLRSREFFEKPSDVKKRRRKAAARRTRMQQQADELS